MMGDNRTQSDDSRFSLGPVPVDNVVGRAFVIVWPLPRASLGLDRDYPDVGETAAGVPGAVAVPGAVVAAVREAARHPQAARPVWSIDRPARTRLSSPGGLAALSPSAEPHARRSRGPSIPPPETAFP